MSQSSKFHNGNPELLQSLQDTYSKDVWKQCLVVFTFSNMAWTHAQHRNPNPGSPTRYEEYIEKFLDRFREELETKLEVEGIDAKTIFDSAGVVNDNQILAIPAGSCPEDPVLPGVNLSWVDEIFHAIIAKCRGSVSKIRYLPPLKPFPWLLRMALLLVGMGCGAGVGSAVGMAWGPAIKWSPLPDAQFHWMILWALVGVAVGFALGKGTTRMLTRLYHRIYGHRN